MRRAPNPRPVRDGAEALSAAGQVALSGPGTVMLAGFHAIGARLRREPASIRTLYFDASRRDARMRQLLERAAQAQVRCVAAEASRLDAMSEAAHQGVVAHASAARRAPGLDALLERTVARTLLLMLDGVTDPRNLGACLRTAAAAGVDAVIIPRDRSAAMGDVVAKAAAGAAEIVPLIDVTNLARAIKDVQDAGIRVVGADAAAQSSLFDTDLAGPTAWVLGSEGKGLRRLTRERCDTLAFIPMAVGMESLNVSVAAGVCLFETWRQRAAASGATLAPDPHLRPPEPA